MRIRSKVISCKMENESDETIARAVQKGDIEAFGALVERYENKMKRYANRFLFEREDVKDVIQDVFIKAYENIQSFDASRRFSPWLYRIAHNEFINAIRKKKKDPLPFFDPDTLFPHPITEETLDDEVHRKDIKAMLETWLSNVDPKYREVLILYYFEELDYAEIAEILRVPISTVGVRLLRGKAALKKIHDKHKEKNERRV